MYIFQLASQHAGWLAARQSVTAANIANSDTPGFKARDVMPFETVLARTELTLASTNPGHMRLAADAATNLATEPEAPWDVSATGNTVALEQELMKVSEDSRMQALDAGLTRSFQRMFLMSLKA